jgi:hypothetical protein
MFRKYRQSEAGPSFIVVIIPKLGNRPSHPIITPVERKTYGKAEEINRKKEIQQRILTLPSQDAKGDSAIKKEFRPHITVGAVRVADCHSMDRLPLTIVSAEREIPKALQTLKWGRG